MAEPEMAFVDLKENMIWAEELVAYVIKSVLQDCINELSTLGRDVQKLEKVIPPFPKITYKEAAEILNENGSSFIYGNDFGAPDETLLSAQFNKPVIIYNWPRNSGCGSMCPVGPMDKASASGAGDSRFESWAGHTFCLPAPSRFTRSFPCEVLRWSTVLDFLEPRASIAQW